MPVYVGIAAKVFFSDTQVLMSTESKFDGHLHYPILTVCHPLFFSKSKMDQFNVSDALATYM
jgi:hypothetical protein